MPELACLGLEPSGKAQAKLSAPLPKGKWWPLAGYQVAGAVEVCIEIGQKLEMEILTLKQAPLATYGNAATRRVNPWMPSLVETVAWPWINNQVSGVLLWSPGSGCRLIRGFLVWTGAARAGPSPHGSSTICISKKKGINKSPANRIFFHLPTRRFAGSRHSIQFHRRDK
jgi:hypothetical protein